MDSVKQPDNIDNAEIPEYIEPADASQFSIQYGEPDEVGNKKTTISIHYTPEQAKNLLKVSQKNSEYSVGWVIAKSINSPAKNLEKPSL